MTYQLNRLICMVRTAMGINMHDHPLIHCRDPDTADLSDMIAQALPAAAYEVCSQAQAEALAECAIDIVPDTVYWHSPVDGTYSGHIFLPDDYMRLLVFEMSDWTMPVVSPLSDDSPMRNAFYSKYASISGTYDRPRCLVTDTSQGHCLIFRSCLSDTATIVQAKYIPIPHTDRHGGISLPSALLQHIITKTASDLLTHKT